MARGINEAHNPNRKVGRGHPLLREEKEMRAESGIYADGYEREKEINERLRQRPKANSSE